MPTPAGVVVADDTDLTQILGWLPSSLVLKAQILGGKRRKGGGVLFTNGPSETHNALAVLLGSSINGQSVEAVLVEERIEFERERYAGIIIDNGEIRLLFARTGGVFIEEITAADSANVATISVDPIQGPVANQLQDCFVRLGYAPEYRNAYEKIGQVLFAMSRAYDATMIEINPLVESSGGKLFALDARVAIDDVALDRQPCIAAMQPRLSVTASAPDEFPGLKFWENPLGGAIGLIGLGGGLNVTLMDWITSKGSKVAALVDIDEAIGAGQAEQGFATAIEAFDRHPLIRSILINVISCGYRLDEIVAALLIVLRSRKGRHVKPLFLHLRGNGMAKAQQMLTAAGRTNSVSIAAAIEALVASVKN